MANNEYFTPDGKVSECSLSLEDWQKKDPSNDKVCMHAHARTRAATGCTHPPTNQCARAHVRNGKGSTVAKTPSDETIIDWAKAKLAIN